MKHLFLFFLIILTGCGTIDNSVRITSTTTYTTPSTDNVSVNHPNKQQCDFFNLVDLGTLPQSPLAEIIKTNPAEMEKKIELLTGYIETLRSFISETKKKFTITYEKYLRSCGVK
jgi:hypothetical protein